MSDTQPRYPAAIDENLRIPRTPSVARLSEAEAPQDYGFIGQNENAHSDLHHAENLSIQQMQRSITPDFNNVSHDHSDPWNVDYTQPAFRDHPYMKKGRNLRIQNTHIFTDNSKPTDVQSSRPDIDLEGIHHSLGGDDNLGDFQAVSGKLWKKKNLPDVPDTMFQLLFQIKNEWPEDYVPYPGDNLKDILIGIIKKMQSVQSELEDKLKELQKLLEQNQNGMDQIIQKIWGVTKNPDGSITWPDNMKIVMGDLNVFSDANPTNSTTANSLRSRDLSNADVKVQ